MARHILVVDDDPSLLEMYQMLLEDEGYHVSLSNAPFEHVTEVERLHPDLIVLDVKVKAPDDGLALLSQLRAYPPTRTLPVLLCTVASAKSVREHVETLRLQGVPVMYKPFEIDKFVRAIADVLDGSIQTSMTLRVDDHGEREGSKLSF